MARVKVLVNIIGVRFVNFDDVHLLTSVLPSPK